jgi:hypothetical protein
MQVLAPQYTQQESVLFKLLAANMNSTADQALVKLLGFSTFLITRVRVANASISLTTAAGGIYTGAAKAGNAVVAAAQTYAALTGSTLGMDLTLAAVGQGVQSTGLNLSLTTAQGAAATADIYLLGIPLT